MKYYSYTIKRKLLYFAAICLFNFLSQNSLLSSVEIENNGLFDSFEKNKNSVDTEPAKKEWTVLVFIEGRNNLNSFAQKNIYDMAMVGSNENLNILVQWYQPQEKTWRYKIDKQAIIPEECVENTNNIAQELVDSMEWAVKKHPARKYCVILWNHGFGIIDPAWNAAQPSWSADIEFTMEHSTDKASSDQILPENISNPRMQIAGITVKTKSKCNPEHRAILFNEIDRTYMTNQDMVYAFSEIKNKILKGKNIDIIGMDACLMDSVEIAYQIGNCADYFVASQEVELAQGWDYIGFLTSLSLDKLSAEDLVKTIVTTYEQYYKNRTELYTQAAINLSVIETIKDNLDQIISALRLCSNYDNEIILSVITRARRRCQQFSMPTFVDLHSFYTELHNQIKFQNQTTFENKDYLLNKGDNPNNPLEKLKQLLSKGVKLIETSVIANTSGKYLSRAKGLSIYFPCNKIDDSYFITDFAQNSLWVNFLHEVIHGTF